MIFLIILLCTCSLLYGSEDVHNILCRLAINSDLPRLTYLIHNIDKDDLKKVVKMPFPLVNKNLIKNINYAIFYVAVDNNNNIVGYKKLFIADEDAKNEIMQQEIRCAGPKSKIVDYAQITFDNQHFTRQCNTKSIAMPFVSKNSDLCIYTGADYVVPSFRNQKICSKLYEYSLNNLFNYLNQKIETYDRLIIFYGLSAYNDFDNEQDPDKSRTTAIIRSFVDILLKRNIPFVQPIEHYRYKSFMPKFKEIGDCYELLPDDQSVPGFGNVLIFNLIK